MDPEAGEVAQKRLREFIEHTIDEVEPSDKGWEKFEALTEAINGLGNAYESSAPTHRAVQEEAQTGPSSPGRDNWFVGLFHAMNREDLWKNHQPGTKLTRIEKFHMFGQILLGLLAVAGVVAIVAFFIYVSMNPEDWQIERNR